jgi:hypothetical protein
VATLARCVPVLSAHPFACSLNVTDVMIGVYGQPTPSPALCSCVFPPSMCPPSSPPPRCVIPSHAICISISPLLRLLDIGTQPPFLEDAPELEGACLRLAAASALLRLVRRHDKWLPGSAYVYLGLMLQDPLEEVRRLFQGKLMRLVAYLQVRGGGRGGGGRGGWLVACLQVEGKGGRGGRGVCAAGWLVVCYQVWRGTRCGRGQEYLLTWHLMSGMRGGVGQGCEGK